MSTLSHTLYPSLARPARPIPVRLPALPVRWWAGALAMWQAQRLLRAHRRILEGMSKAALRDIGMEAGMPVGRHDTGTRLLSQVGPV